MSPDPRFDRLRRLPIPAPDDSAKAKALHRSLAALGNSPVSTSAPLSSLFGRKAALPALFACLALFAWIGITERRNMDDTASLKQILGQMETTFQNQLAAVVLTNGNAQVVLSKEATSPSKPVLLTLREGGNTVRIVTFSGRWLDLPVNGVPIHVQVIETGSGRVALAGDTFFWDGTSRPVNGLRIQGRFL